MAAKSGGSIPDRAKGWLHRAVSLIIYAEIIGKAFCAVLLPTPWAVKVMPISLAARLLPDSFHRRVMENLETVFGETYTEGQRREIARRYFGQFFVYLLDFFLGVRMKASDVDKIFVFEGRENVDEALRQGNGIIGVTGHYFWAVRGLLAIGCLAFVKDVLRPRVEFWQDGGCLDLRENLAIDDLGIGVVPLRAQGGVLACANAVVEGVGLPLSRDLDALLFECCGHRSATLGAFQEADVGIAM